MGIVAPQGNAFGYLSHFPLGKPDETVAEEIPEHIKEDFKEALRCLWVDAYNATAEMCRRALEAACLDLGAPKDKVLEKMIDSLEADRKITPYLKDAAHKIRLGGNRGAHPHPDGPAAVPVVTEGPVEIVEKIEKEHAERSWNIPANSFITSTSAPSWSANTTFQDRRPQHERITEIRSGSEEDP